MSRDDGLGDISTWTTPEGTQVAMGHDEVGKMVSAYTHMTSSAVTAECEFNEAFRASVVEAVAQLNLPPNKTYLAGPESRDPPPPMRRWERP